MMIFAAAAGTPRGIARASQPGKLPGIQLADFIRASGVRAAQTGRANDRSAKKIKTARKILAKPELSTNGNAWKGYPGSSPAIRAKSGGLCLTALVTIQVV